MAEPIQFRQGRTFAFLGTLEESIPVGTFKDWTVKAQIRRKNNRLPTGLLANLVVEAVDPDNSNEYTVFCADTSKWPPGPAEMDLLFTKPNSSYTIPTVKVQFEILSAVTNKCP